MAPLVDQIPLLCRTPLKQIPCLEDFNRGRATLSARQTVALPAGMRVRRPYPVLRGTATSELLTKVGERVEVVGKIVAVKEGEGRGGRAYAFLNFDDYRKGAFALVLWEKPLKMLTQRGRSVESFGNQWVSVTGLVEAYGSQQLRPQFIVADPAEIQILRGQEEAERILAEGATSAFPAPRSGYTPAATAQGQDVRQGKERSGEVRGIDTSNPLSASPTKPMRPSIAMPPAGATPAERNQMVRDNLARLAASNQAPPSVAASKPSLPSVSSVSQTTVQTGVPPVATRVPRQTAASTSSAGPPATPMSSQINRQSGWTLFRTLLVIVLILAICIILAHLA